MEKKILLPTDFSRSSWNAIRYATKLYENQECDFYMLNTYAKDAYGLDSLILLDPDDAFNKLSQGRSKEELGNILMWLSANDKDLRHRFHVLSRSEEFLKAVKVSSKVLR